VFGERDGGIVIKVMILRSKRRDNESSKLRTITVRRIKDINEARGVNTEEITFLLSVEAFCKNIRM
jgi:hypothetical protein